MNKQKVAIKLAALIILAVAPFVVLELTVWPGTLGIAFFGVLAAGMCWLHVGSRMSVVGVIAFAALAMVGMLCNGHVVATGALLLLLGIGYGFIASKGLGPAFLQIPILVPYFAMELPPLFSTSTPALSIGYLLGVAFVLVACGLWLVFLLHLAMPHRSVKALEIPDRNQALIYGLILGVFSSGVVVLVTIWAPESHWAWITLTLYLLANPIHLLDWTRLRDRVLGTAVGFLLVFLMYWLPLPSWLVTTLSLVSIWLCLYMFATKKAYWLYAIFLTAAVVSISSVLGNHLLFDDERIGFTIVGSILAIAVAFFTNIVLFRKPGKIAV